MSKNRISQVLLVEDNPDHAYMIQTALLDSGLVKTIHTETNGEEALNYLYRRGVYEEKTESPRPSLILLDIRLPRMDGLEVLRQIKGEERLKSIPVILLTTSSEKSEIAQGYGYGANSYVTKPLKFEEFMNRVKNIAIYWLLTNTLPVLENNGCTS